MPIEQRIEEYQPSNNNNSQLQQLDDMITNLLNYARKKIERRSRGIPFSQEKLVRWNKLQYWKKKRKLTHGHCIDLNQLQRQKEIAEITFEIGDISEIEKCVKEAQDEWDEMKINRKDHREKYLLDLSKKEINEDTTNYEKEQKRALRIVLKHKNKMREFKYLTTHAGRGPNQAFNRFHVQDENQSNH